MHRICLIVSLLGFKLALSNNSSVSGDNVLSNVLAKYKHTIIDSVNHAKVNKPSEQSIINSGNTYELCEQYDFTDDCPVNWKSKHGKCIAPEYYTKTSTVSFDIPKSTDIKQELTNTLGVNWPCMDSCTEDYDYPCPVGWSQDYIGRCFSNSTDLACKPGVYNANSVLIKELQEFVEFDGALATESMKIRFSVLCKAQWPCKTRCQRDYRFRCPLGWLTIVDSGSAYCHAVDTYHGPCFPVQGVPKTLQARQQFEQKCQVMYPCIERSQRDYDVPCPEGFLEEPGSDNIVKCVSFDDDYVGFCPSLHKLKRNSTITDKQRLELKCSIRWPSVLKPNSCVKDYLDPCPINFQLKDSLFCELIKPNYYSGTCGVKIPYINDPEYKRKMEVHCNVHFACSNSSLKSLWEGYNKTSRNFQHGSSNSDTNKTNNNSNNRKKKGPISLKGRVIDSTAGDL